MFLEEVSEICSLETALKLIFLNRAGELLQESQYGIVKHSADWFEREPHHLPAKLKDLSPQKLFTFEYDILGLLKQTTAHDKFL